MNFNALLLSYAGIYLNNAGRMYLRLPTAVVSEFAPYALKSIVNSFRVGAEALGYFFIAQLFRSESQNAAFEIGQLFAEQIFKPCVVLLRGLYILRVGGEVLNLFPVINVLHHVLRDIFLCVSASEHGDNTVIDARGGICSE